MRTTRTLIWLCAACTFLASCSLVDPEEPLPGYVVIPDFEFTTNYSTEGSDSERITEVWVFADDRMLGAYELPAQVPILSEGAVELQIFPGIKNNGIVNSRIIYPFYQSHRETVFLEPLKKDTVRPQFVYKSNITIRLIDDFELANVFVLDNNTQGTMNRINDPEIVFEGTRSLHLALTAEEVVTRIVSNEQQFLLPTTRQSWLEMNYRCDNTFAMGLVRNNANGSTRELIMVLTPTMRNSSEPVWNKIYIELNDVTWTSQPGTYEVYFEMVKDQGNTTANMWLDNVKIVHF